MKRLLTLILTLAVSSTAFAAAELKQVCHDRVGKNGRAVVDKSNKPVQVCKMIKVHKKLTGTVVPSTR